MIYTGGFNEPAPGFLFATISGTAFLYWGCMRLKVVQLDGERLYISNYLKRVEVDPADIEKITECVLMNTNPVWIHFKAPTEFGSKIMFMPKTRWFSFFSSHPIVAELREIAKARGAFPSGT
ncbi:MAG: hypothetical protein NXI24_06305 [bacterium]|nr:hypothetical protein [bacterium]